MDYVSFKVNYFNHCYYVIMKRSATNDYFKQQNSGLARFKMMIGKTHDDRPDNAFDISGSGPDDRIRILII